MSAITAALYGSSMMAGRKKTKRFSVRSAVLKWREVKQNDRYRKRKNQSNLRGWQRRWVIQMDIQTKCSECIYYFSEAKGVVPCDGVFPERCPYNGTEEEDEEE